ncbi:unnamed protein product [Bursaphelenchus xylophilus]|nr:unnamed protein product [Bursaphelenchus xylophilus]CAG9129834.1 unnamed protein product [Bursaphelenchus xylophilus]
MATGSLIVRSQSTEDPSTSESSMDLKSSESSNSSSDRRASLSAADCLAPRRHSFREVRRVASSSDEDDEEEDGCQKKRKFSMDQHRPRSLRKENRCRSELPCFVSKLADLSGAFSPSARIATSSNMASEFLAPSPVNKKTQISRPNSPLTNSSVLQRPLAVASRHRLASIRRESDCGQENEVAHEKMVKTTQQVSTGFEDFCIDDKVAEERKRAKSLAEPISVFTNAFLPQSSSPSPTRSAVDAQKVKQCYSPSTNQMVRSNISYSPSPSPTPASPTRSRIMRSMSPIAVRQVSKRRYTATGSLSGIESDNEGPMNGQAIAKRTCMVRSAASPLVRDSLSAVDTQSDYRSSSPQSVCSNSSFTPVNRARYPDNVSNHQNSVDSDDNATIDESLTDQFYLNAPNDTCSTTSISRTETPVDEQMLTEETESSSVVFGPRAQPLSIRDSPLPPPSPLASKSITFT